MDITIENLGKIVIVTLSGKFFLGNIHEFEKILESQSEDGPNIIAIDCKKLKFIDSSAIGTLVKLLNSVDENKTEIVFVDLSKSIISLFTRAKLNQVFKIIQRDLFEKEFLEKCS